MSVRCKPAMEGTSYLPDSNISSAHTEMPIPSTSLSTNNNQHHGKSQSEAEIILKRQADELEALYSENEITKKHAEKLRPTATIRNISNGEGDIGQRVDDLLDSFMHGVDTVLDELTTLGNAHPVLAVVIFAFHEVVKLDIRRRDNNKKVLVVVLQMQSMLGPMLQLRNLDHSHMLEASRQFHEVRLSERVEIIKHDINKCRSDLKHFMDSKFLHKLVLSAGYEKAFATHMETFAQHRVELQTIISEYIAIGTSAANIAIAQVRAKVDVMDDKLDQIISVLFRNLDTPHEQNVLKFMRQNDGPENCVNDPILLPKLVSKAGELSKTGKDTISDRKELENLQKFLNKALKEDLSKVLESHYSRFEGFLRVQSNNVNRMLAIQEDQGALVQTEFEKIRETLMKMKNEVKLEDEEISDIWNRMKLGNSSVKAKVFVLTFRDHIRTENSASDTPIPSPGPLPHSETESNMPQSAMQIQDDSKWVFDYVDVAYARPIVEAMDEDGSGFISVKEANNFALSRDRPKGMKILSWIAYWAAGWHINLVKYQKAIYSILLQMHEALPFIHVANRTYVDDFLDEPVMMRVEALCRSLNPLPDTRRKHPELLVVANEVASKQLDYLKTNLTHMKYFVESSFDATTISGSARVETWIFPILYLLFERYLEIVNVAKTVVLDHSEFESHITSLNSVFSVFDDRIEILEAKFRQLHQDVDAHFHSFSYGMFYAAYKKNELDTWLNTLLTLKTDEYKDQKDTSVKGKGVPDADILSKPLGKVLEVEDLDLLPPSAPPTDHVTHLIEGNWFGWAAVNGNNHLGPHRCVIHPVIDNKLVGKGEAFFGAIDIVGTVSTDPQSEKIEVRFESIPAESEWRRRVCEGFYDPVRDTIEGTFEWKYEEPTPAAGEGVATVESTPEDDAELSKTANSGRKEGEEANQGAAMAKDNEDGGKLPKFPAEERAPDRDLVVDEGNKEVETPTERAQSNSTVDSAAEPEIINNDAPIRNSTGANDGLQEQSSGGAETIKESLNEVEQARLETTDKAGVDLEAANKEKEPQNRFYFTRTPSHVFRFRPLLDGPGPAPCWGAWPIWRRRWAFAIEAILYETRKRMWSRKAVRESLMERRRWLYYSIKDRLPDNFEWEMNVWESFLELAATVQPDVGRIWERTATFMLERETYIPGRRECDRCSNDIAFCRYQCIVCVNNDSNSIDLCQNCFDKPEGALHTANFKHLPSHTLLRSWKRVHSYEVNSLISAAHLTSEQCKKTFRELENAQETVKGIRKIPLGSRKAAAQNLLEHDKPVEKPPTCACCDKKVALPCWVCFECSPIAYICMNCDRKHARVNQAKHSVLEHHLLLIRDSVEVKFVKAAKDANVECQLDDINKNISAIDEKVNQLEDISASISTLDERVNQLDDISTSISTLDERVGQQLQEVQNVAKNMARMIGINWDEATLLSAKVPEVGPEEAELGAEGEASVVPAFSHAKDEGEEDSDSQQLDSTIRNEKTPCIVGTANGDDSAGFKQPGPSKEEENSEVQQAESSLGYEKALVVGNGNGNANSRDGERSSFEGGGPMQFSLRDRMTVLEANVKNMSQTLRDIVQDDRPGALVRKLDALESKMDRQFGEVLALMQNFVASSERVPEVFSGSKI